MSLVEILLTAFSLSLDAVAIAMAAGALSRLQLREKIKIALVFAAFQGVMPLLGWGFGSAFSGYAVRYGTVVGAIALFAVGVKMLYEAIRTPKQDEIEKEKHITNWGVLLVLGVSTSIDALVVGVTYSLVPTNVLFAAAIIAAVTGVLSFVGLYAGQSSRRLAGNKIEIIGALILIGLAIKILLF